MKLKREGRLSSLLDLPKMGMIGIKKEAMV